MGCMQNRIGECGAVRHWRLSEPTFTPLLRSLQGASVVSHQGQGCLSGTQHICQGQGCLSGTQRMCQGQGCLSGTQHMCQGQGCLSGTQRMCQGQGCLSGTQHMCQGQGCLSGTQRGKGVALIKLQISPISEKSNGICQVTNPQQC